MHQLAGESVLIAAGGRAILLQLADPAVGRGVAEHSDFAHRPLDRLHATLTFVYTVAFGTPDEQAEVVRRVNRAHGPVHDTDGGGAGGGAGDPDGPGRAVGPSYNAFTPELQLWVAATLYESASSMYERVYGELPASVADELYAGYEKLGTALQVPDGYWPSDRQEFDEYWDARLGTLAPTPAAVSVAHALLYPTTGPLWLRIAMPLGRLVTTGLLPAALREPFNLPWSSRRQRRFDRLISVTRRVYPTLPRVIRHWPKDHYLRVLRAQMREARQATASV